MSKKQYPSYDRFIEETDEGEKLPFKAARLLNGYMIMKTLEQI